MHKKIGTVVVGVALLVFPLVASASVLSDLQAQVQSLLAQLAALQQSHFVTTPSSASATPAMPALVCPQIVRSFSVGSTGDDVKSLQAYLGVSQTGYYGPLTANAVATFQTSEGISSIGIFGPQTRAAFARHCGSNPYTGGFSASPTSGRAPLYVSYSYRPQTESSGGSYYIDFGDGTGQQMNTVQIYCITTPCISPATASHTYASAGTYTATVSTYIACLYGNPRCLIPQPAPLGSVTITVGGGSTAGAPSISGVDGPTSLSVGQSGLWSVHVNDSSGYLSYSVHWGDEGPMPLYSAAASTPVSSTGTFTHTYTSTGTYSPSFTVTNGSGLSSSASATVQVGSATVLTGTLSASPTNGAAPLAVHFSTTNMTQSPSTIHDWYSVDFGDGTNAELALAGCSGSIGCADHSYTQSGTYTARIVHHPDPQANCPTTNGTYCGSTLTFNTVTITVTAVSAADFSASPTAGPAPLSVSFAAPFAGTTYSVDFGDGQYGSMSAAPVLCPSGGSCPASRQFVVHSYASAGTYTANLQQQLTPVGGGMPALQTIGSVTVTVY